MIYVIFLLTLLYQCGNFQSSNMEAVTAYESSLQTSLRLERDDRRLRSAWHADLQTQRIRVAARSRAAADRQREHCFHNTGADEKWRQCVFVHRRRIRHCTQLYLSGEGGCVAASARGDGGRAASVEQLEREIRKWRKGYRYLVNTCEAENPGDAEGAQECLVQFMEKDHYNQVIERLMTLKLEAMRHLSLDTSASVANLERCLQRQLSAFSEDVRATVEVLDKCYSITNANTTRA